MNKIIKKTILTILLVVWIFAISAADSMLEVGDLYWVMMFLCIAPLAIIAWLCNKGWLDDILDKDVEE